MWGEEVYASIMQPDKGSDVARTQMSEACRGRNMVPWAIQPDSKGSWVTVVHDSLPPCASLGHKVVSPSRDPV